MGVSTKIVWVDPLLRLVSLEGAERVLSTGDGATGGRVVPRGDAVFATIFAIFYTLPGSFLPETSTTDLRATVPVPTRMELIVVPGTLVVERGVPVPMSPDLRRWCTLGRGSDIFTVVPITIGVDVLSGTLHPTVFAASLELCYGEIILCRGKGVVRFFC